MDPKVKEMLDNADLGRVATYVGLFDRMLLYAMAVNFLPRETLLQSIDLCEAQIKKTINSEACSRTKFLEGSIDGRKHKFIGTPDGEAVRLHNLAQWEVVKHLIRSNLRIDKPDASDDDLGIGAED